MSYQALYRTWRPQTFESLIGQPHVRQTLSNALLKKQIAHAYLFCGPRGTGKTSAAKLFAKAVNCLHPDGAEPCNVCDACVSITRGNNVDVEEIDAASNRGVDEIRELRDKVHYAPTMVKRKVYIVDEVHMLTSEAFNALLKTLEEPPSHVLFMLATTEPHRIPNTIISRCQRFDFHRISPETIVSRLNEVVVHEGWLADPKALWKIAEAADGGLRDALGLLEQAAAFGDHQIAEDHVAEVIGGVSTGDLLLLIQALAGKSYLEVTERLSNWYATGKDATRIAFDLLQVLRDLFIVKLSQNDDALAGKPIAPYRATLEAEDCPSEWLLRGIQRLGELYTQLRYVEQPRLALEAVLFGLASELVPAAEKQSEVARYSATVTKTTPQVVETPVAPPSEQPRDISSGRPSAPTQATPRTDPEPSAQAAGRSRLAVGRGAAGGGGADKKRETLTRLYRDRNPEFEAVVRERWDDVLHKVKSDRIQTHAWLMNGEVVMATDFAIVLSFASRIHREAVMKAADRQTIETALAVMMERELQMFALLKADWDGFVASLGKDEKENDETPDEVEPDSDRQRMDQRMDQGMEIVERAKALFGEDKVMVQNEE